ncbi:MULTISPECIES: metal ABC transporter ATP-binding protein [unclassified Sulfurospirillum]|uniref:metal ABC transporter ATP-binding protein n=1 Tax=Sulfurospirillum sp. UCH001 TaxID=1581011 RepID=UPI0008345BEB|nr:MULTISPECIES: ABC transporter ATP-binding protein [unclassified Sulfurospirillum]WNY97746.1 ABC transporter ATP-binding protein [Sulfurospirillum sp. 'SP']
MQNDIQINHLYFSYDGATVLEDINLSYNKNEFLAIIGPNGGGKSTLLKMMIGLLEPERGEVLLFGEKPLQVSHEIAYVPQDTIANKDFPIKVMDVVLMGRLSKSKAFATYSKEDREIALRMLERVGMKGFENQKINTLSGGQRQRVFIARALACEAKIMFLDEPTASIDTAGQIDMFKLLKSLNETVGIVIISHDINVALNYATKVVHVNRTLFMHDVPKSQNFRVFENQNEHVCPVELISATRCNHTHKERA